MIEQHGLLCELYTDATSTHSPNAGQAVSKLGDG
jgi:hypothetical protein